MLIGVTPPVPATVGIQRCELTAGNLRVQHEQIVRFGPLVQAAAGRECVANILGRLRSAMHRNMQPATFAGGTGLGNIQKRMLEHLGLAAADLTNSYKLAAGHGALM